MLKLIMYLPSHKRGYNGKCVFENVRRRTGRYNIYVKVTILIAMMGARSDREDDPPIYFLICIRYFI